MRHRTSRTFTSAAAGLALVLAGGSGAWAIGDPTSTFGHINPSVLEQARRLANATRPVSAPAEATFTIDAPTVTAHLPEPMLRTHVTGRQVRLDGQWWEPGATVTVTNLSLASVHGDERAAEPWEGQLNGRSDGAELCDLASAPGHRLRCDAAAGFDAMAAAYAQDLGRPLRLTDSYRTYATQVALKATKPALAATPGRSNHGFGLAVDLADGAGNPGTVSHRWLYENSTRFGWVHPVWARPGGSLPEPWHWEFFGAEPTTVRTQVGPDGAWSLSLGYLLAGENVLLVEVGDAVQEVTVRTAAVPKNPD